MSDNQEPVVLDLAPLPREQLGPFVLLGLEKDAGKEQIEANWAQRVIWARKRLTQVQLEDINWAREWLNDRERRARADAVSLNLDTADGVLRRLQERFAGGRPGWRPLDVEKDLRGYAPAVAVPDPAEVRAALRPPEVPREVPAAAGLLQQVALAPLDPWEFEAEGSRQ